MRKLRVRKGRKVLEGVRPGSCQNDKLSDTRDVVLYVPSTCEPDLPDEYSSEKMRKEEGRNEEEEAGQKW
jgi:hypothetical protein